jgi:hypothetical protein
VEAVTGREGEQLDQAASLAQTPPIFLDGSGPHRDPEAAQQPDTHGLEFHIRCLFRKPVVLLYGRLLRIIHPLDSSP